MSDNNPIISVLVNMGVFIQRREVTMIERVCPQKPAREIDEMEDLQAIRERIARRDEERRTTWLRQHRRRYFSWALASTLFAMALAAVAVLTGSTTFGGAAVCLILFAWSRWTEYRRVANWLSQQSPEDETEVLVWARIFYDEASPSVWLKLSNAIAVAAATMGAVVVAAMMMSHSGPARLGVSTQWLASLVYQLAALCAFSWALGKRIYSREVRVRAALS